MVRSIKALWMVGALLGCLDGKVDGQQSLPLAERNTPVLLSTDLHFVSKEIKVNAPSSFTQGWPVCGSGATVLMRYIQDVGLEHGGAMSMTPHGIGMSISPDGTTHLFPYERIRNLYRIQIHDTDLGDDEVLFHLWAGTTDPSAPDLSTLQLVPNDTPPPKLYGADYLAFFKRNGDYLSAMRLDLPFKPVKLALLPDNEVLVIGVDKIHVRPVLAVIDRAGQVRRYLEADKTLPQANKALHDLPKQSSEVFGEGVPDWSKLIIAVGRYQFSHHGKNILLLVPGIPTLVIEITAGTSMRTVPIQIPDGLTVDAVLPSSGGSWVLRCHGRTDNDATLVEFDPQNGTAIREIKTGDVPPSAITCVEQGTFYGYRFVPKTDQVSVLEGR